MAILTNNQTIGNYEVKRLIKENTYCETYRVEDDNEQPFFLKLFILKNTPSKMLTEDHKVMCIEMMSTLKHKNIVSYIEQGAFTDEEVGECEYVVTNYFSGELLADKLSREGKLPVEEAVRIMKEILEGLAFLHQNKLFHNDITPRNIMLSENTGEAELIDLSHISSYATGSPVFDTSDLDERYQANNTFVGIYNNTTDLFSAVALFYTMLTGHAPWGITLPDGATRKERIKIVKKSRDKDIDLSDLDIPAGYCKILQKGLTLDRDSSYFQVDVLMEDLVNPDHQWTPEAKDETNSSRGNTPTNLGSKKGISEDKDTEANITIQKGQGHGFQDIAGMGNLKQMLQQKVIFILKDKEKAEKYKLLPPNGMLFYGPPGCGKSFFAEKFAEETGFNFILVKASDLGSIYVHGSQGKIADLFKKAEQSQPTIICFDEFDAFVPNRGAGGAEHQAGEVNEFLTQLNNCAKRGIFVIATSNRPDMIDPAVLRTGRIDKLVYVPMPDKEARQEMFRLHLDGRPCEDINTTRLAELTDGYIASDIAYIVNDAAMGAAYSDRPISQQILEETISSIRPSISKEVLVSYETLHSKMEDTSNRNSRPKIGFIK